MRDRRPTVRLTIDGVECDAYVGESLLQVARRHDIHIPTLCYLEGLSTWGACRLCVVEIGGQHVAHPACATPAAEEMEVWTDTPKLRGQRRTILELLFAEGNHVCAVCVANGNCELQDRAVDAGMDHVRFDDQAPNRTVDASHPDYVYDPNRCILCTRCVRVCDEIEGARVWDVAMRGHQAQVVADLGKPWGESTSCTRCGKCVAVCPTGSLSHQGSSVGEGRHAPGLVAWLVAARRDHEWSPREGGR